MIHRYYKRLYRLQMTYNYTVIGDIQAVKVHLSMVRATVGVVDNTWMTADWARLHDAHIKENYRSRNLPNCR